MKPYGTNELNPLYVNDPLERKELIKEAKEFHKIEINSQTNSNAVMLGAGYFNPITGFMNKNDSISIAEKMLTKEGLFWPIPILNQIKEIKKIPDKVALIDPYTKRIIAIQYIDEIEELSKEESYFIADKIFGTKELRHPGIKNFFENGNTIISGPIKVLNFSYFEEDYPCTFQTAYSIKNKINELGWKKVVAFQTRNPMHRAHEELCKIAKQKLNADGILIHMVLGKLKNDDVSASIREKCIKIVANNYFEPSTVLVAGYGYDMYYAGPREAILHAIIRQNCGATHIIIGRDHAGVCGFYKPFEAQDIFNKIPPGFLEIEIYGADEVVWSKKLHKFLEKRYAINHNEEDFLTLSGTKMREMLMAGTCPPRELLRPEVTKILMDYYRQQLQNF